ncbi:DUF72 domain-containing protein [Pseudorhodoferax sp.]|uniref:DUF72 domain-containing protein n=1 Tax=Pseudorhodoferax sp. TaxID=1993553 RepID=UPI002DD6A209|nr:DUF72 domain-containing protein [Pseudorhodoferax sp.]
MTILVGTASWTDKTLIACGRFYPPQAKTAEARLRYYATQFPMVEVDSSYYAMPSVASAAKWAERTPEDFVFSVKAFRLFTGHQTALAVMHRDLQQALATQGQPVVYYQDVAGELRDELWHRFKQTLAPLQQAGKLAAVHFQFAPWVQRNRRGRLHVEECVARMVGHQVAVEFRHESWFQPEVAVSTLDWLRSLGAVHVVVDGPQGFSNSVPPIWEATQPSLAILRLHGRNAASWNVRGAVASSSRFDYVYREDELRELVPRIECLAERVDRLLVVFNTNNEDQGQRNGRALMALLN